MGVSQAAAVLGLDLKDVGSNTANGPGNYSPALDGVAGAFINYDPLDIQTFSGAFPFTGDVGTGTILGEGADNPPNSFSSGTVYFSSPVEFFTFGGGLDADISGGVLTFSSLDFGFNIIPATVEVPPDPGTLSVNWVVPTGPNTYDVSFMWTHLFPWDPLDTGPNAPYHVYLEGTMTTSPVPIPAAAWLLLSGLLAFAGSSRQRAG
jgi:hypothetical protein